MRISKIQHSKLAESLRNLLRDQVIAELSLIVHYSEIVIVTGAKQAVRHHLVLPFSTLDRPDCSSARLESIIRDILRVNNSKRLWEAFLENLGQCLLLLFGQKVGPMEILRDLSQNAVFG